MQLDLINNFAYDELKKNGIKFFHLSEENMQFTEEQLFEYSINEYKKYLDIGGVFYTSLTIEKITHIIQPTRYDLIIECLDKTWTVTDAFQKRGSSLHILMFISTKLNEIYKHYNCNCSLDLAHFRYFDLKSQMLGESLYYHVPFINTQETDLYSYLSTYPFHEQLMNQKGRQFSNNNIEIGDFRFLGGIIDYRTLTLKSNTNKTIEELISDVKEVKRFELNITGRLGVWLNLSNKDKHESAYKLVIELFCWLYVFGDFKINRDNSHVFINIFKPNSSDEKYTIELKNSNFYGELNSILSMVGISKRVFKFNHDKYFINDLDQGLYIISLFNQATRTTNTPKLNFIIEYREKEFRQVGILLEEEPYEYDSDDF